MSIGTRGMDTVVYTSPKLREDCQRPLYSTYHRYERLSFSSLLFIMACIKIRPYQRAPPVGVAVPSRQVPGDRTSLASPTPWALRSVTSDQGKMMNAVASKE
jgi:hypothetical protein